MIRNDSIIDKPSDIQIGEQVLMEIDPGAAALILDNLIKMYTNPHLAVLRELTSNAWDSHTKAGQTRAVEVTLPTYDKPELIVQDWGVGLTRDELKMYGQFGRSTKRDNNEENGSFGLGSKSPLSLATQFIVTAVKDGKRNTVVVGRRADGHPVMNFLDEDDTKDDNGVTVTVPLDQSSKYDNLNDNLFFVGWAPGTILINGQAPTRSVYDGEATTLNNVGWVYKSGQLRDLNESRSVRVLVGPVLYTWKFPSTRTLRKGLSERAIDYTLTNSILKVDMGAVDFTPSREGIVDNERTHSVLNNLAELLLVEAELLQQITIDNQPNMKSSLLKWKSAVELGFDSNKLTIDGALFELPTHNIGHPEYKTMNLFNVEATKVSYKTKSDFNIKMTNGHAYFGLFIGSVGMKYASESGYVWTETPNTKLIYHYQHEDSGTSMPFAPLKLIRGIAEENDIEPEDITLVVTKHAITDLPYMVKIVEESISTARISALLKLANIAMARNRKTSTRTPGEASLSRSKIAQVVDKTTCATFNIPIEELDTSIKWIPVYSKTELRKKLTRSTQYSHTLTTGFKNRWNVVAKEDNYGFIFINANTKISAYTDHITFHSFEEESSRLTSLIKDTISLEHRRVFATLHTQPEHFKSVVATLSKIAEEFSDYTLPEEMSAFIAEQDDAWLTLRGVPDHADALYDYYTAKGTLPYNVSVEQYPMLQVLGYIRSGTPEMKILLDYVTKIDAETTAKM
jgi:hypothetical protein